MKIVQVSLAALFGNNGQPHPELPDTIYLDKWEWEGNETGAMAELKKFIPEINPDYRFRVGMVRDFCAWFLINKEPLFLYGPTGCGKSSFVKEVYARLGIPLYRLTISQDTELAEIFGHMVLVEGGKTEFRYGPAALAAKHGLPLLLDEIGRGNPAVMVGLNGLFEGTAFAITGNGEVMVPKESFRVILTDNTNLAGDESGNYNTAMIQDKSILDRIGMSIKVDYPDAEEREILRDYLAKLAPVDLLEYWFDQEQLQVSLKDDKGVVQTVKKGSDVTLDDFITGILQVRDMVRQQSIDGGNTDAAALERTMSVRSLTRWVGYCIAFHTNTDRNLSALHYALERALTNTCTPTSKLAIHAMVTSVFGVKEKLV